MARRCKNLPHNCRTIYEFMSLTDVCDSQEHNAFVWSATVLPSHGLHVGTWQGPPGSINVATRCRGGVKLRFCHISNKTCWCLLVQARSWKLIECDDDDIEEDFHVLQYIRERINVILKYIAFTYSCNFICTVYSNRFFSKNS